uniref:Uncharacterized protein n=1 Tax=Macaca fascicularis TaxID=9541 RepID=A0A7N9CN37_MACFA
MGWRLDLGLFSLENFLICLGICIILKNSSRIHVHNVQVCYICILVPCWCAAPIKELKQINSSFTSV